MAVQKVDGLRGAKKKGCCSNENKHEKWIINDMFCRGFLWSEFYGCWRIFFCSYANTNKDELTPNLFSFQFHKMWHVQAHTIFFLRTHKMVRWCGHIVARFHRKICIKLKIWRKKRKQHFVIFYFPFCVNSLIWITSLSQQYQHIKWKSFRWWMRSSIYFNRTRS